MSVSVHVCMCGMHNNDMACAKVFNFSMQNLMLQTIEASINVSPQRRDEAHAQQRHQWLRITQTPQ